MKHPPRPCEKCGVGFKPAATTRRFCSPLCAGAARSARAGKGYKTVRSCAHCNEPFQLLVRNTAGKFCSLACSIKARIIHQPRPCAGCGVITKFDTASRRFCSQKCWGVSKRDSTSRKRVPVPCKHCKVDFPQTSNRRLFCSSACMIAARTVNHLRPCRTCGKTCKPHSRFGLYCSRKCTSLPRRGCKFNPTSLVTAVGGHVRRGEIKQALLRAQQNMCAVCGDHFTSTRHTHLDHDHIHGTVRGVLCRACNMAMGAVRDDPARIERLLTYAREHESAALSAAVALAREEGWTAPDLAEATGARLATVERWLLAI